MPIIIKILDIITLVYTCFYLVLFIYPLAGITSISGPTFGLFFLFLTRYLIGRDSFSGSTGAIIKRGLSGLSDKKLLITAGSAIFIIFTVLSIMRHLSFSSGASDLGIFDQAIWNTTRGDILFSSLKGNMNLLGDHFEPILLLIAPLYMLWENVVVLFLVQSVLLASAVAPLYLIAKDRLNSRFLIFAFIASFVLSAPLRGVGLSDFHPECFILPLFFWGYYFLEKRKNGLLVLVIFLLLLCKEDTAFLVSGLGIFACFAQKRLKTGLVLFLSGIAAWIIITRFIIPHFNPGGVYPYMNRLPFGMTYGENLRTVFSDPGRVAASFLTRDKITYCVKMFMPLGFLSLLSPGHYILFAIPLFKNLLPVDPNFSGFYDVTSHYTASLLPFIFIAGIFAAGRLTAGPRGKKSALYIGIFIILCSLFSYSKTDGSRLSRFLDGIKIYHSGEVFTYLKTIPKDASVAANFNLVPHLSHRKYVFEWNPRAKAGDITEYIVIDMKLLEYLSGEDVAAMPDYLKKMSVKGYRGIFLSPDKSFYIFHKPDIDKTLVEKI